MLPEPSFVLFCRGLHQDAGVLYSSTDEMVTACLVLLSVNDRRKLKRYLTRALTNRTDAELKGLLNRHASDVAFKSKSARAFLRATLLQLESSDD